MNDNIRLVEVQVADHFEPEDGDWFEAVTAALAHFYIPAEIKERTSREVHSGNHGAHDWAVKLDGEQGYLVFVDDRPISYRSNYPLAVMLAMEVIARLIQDGDYRLNDRPAGFMPPPLADKA